MPTTYYVDGGEKGSDENTGTTESHPWKSLHKVNTSTFEPGDTILFRGGAGHSPEVTAGSPEEKPKYATALLIPPSNGTEAAPITFGAYGEGKAIIKVARGHFPQVYLKERKWLIFENLIFESKEWNEAKWTEPYAGAIESQTPGEGEGGSQHITIRNCEANWVGRFVLIFVTKDEHWTIEGCTVSHTGMSCIDADPVKAGTAFPTGWVIESNSFTNYAETQIGTAATHGIYGRLKAAKVKFNVFESSKFCKGACISQRGSGWEIVGNVLKANENGTPYGFFPYQEEAGTTLFAYNKAVATVGSHAFAWYCQSEDNEEVKADIAESFTICNNTFYCPNSEKVINPTFLNATKSGNSKNIAKITLIIKNNLVVVGSATQFPLYVVTETNKALGEYAENNNLFGLGGKQEYRIEDTVYKSYEEFHKGLGGAEDKNEEPNFTSGEPPYSLARTSPAVAAGTTSVKGAPTYKEGEDDLPFEYSGKKPDIGAAQYLVTPIFIGEPTVNVSVAKVRLGIPPAPIGAQSGDLLVMMLVCPEGKPTLPAGWSEVKAKLEGEVKRATYIKQYKGESSLGTVEGEKAGYFVIYIAAIRGWNLTEAVNKHGGWTLGEKEPEFTLAEFEKKEGTSEANCLAIGLISSEGGLIKGPSGGVWTEQKGGIAGSIGTAIFSRKLAKAGEKIGEEKFSQPEANRPATMTLAIAPV